MSKPKHPPIKATQKQKAKLLAHEVARRGRPVTEYLPMRFGRSECPVPKMLPCSGCGDWIPISEFLGVLDTVYEPTPKLTLRAIGKCPKCGKYHRFQRGYTLGEYTLGQRRHTLDVAKEPPPDNVLDLVAVSKWWVARQGETREMRHRSFMIRLIERMNKKDSFIALFACQICLFSLTRDPMIGLFVWGYIQACLVWGSEEQAESSDLK